MNAISNILDWFKDNIKQISTRALEALIRIVYTIPLTEDWKTSEEVTEWVCPEGQYEVFARNDGGSLLNLMLNGAYICYESISLGFWYPAEVSVYFEISNVDPVTGDVTGNATCGMAETFSVGWSLSTGDVLRDVYGTPFFVRFRRVA